MKILCTLLVLCHFGLNETSIISIEASPILTETSPILTNENKSSIQVFRISSEHATFDDAVSICKEKDSILFEPQTHEDNQKVYDQISQFFNQTDDGCDGYFIGIRNESGM